MKFKIDLKSALWLYVVTVVNIICWYSFAKSHLEVLQIFVAALLPVAAKYSIMIDPIFDEQWYRIYSIAHLLMGLGFFIVTYTSGLGMTTGLFLLANCIAGAVVIWISPRPKKVRLRTT